MTIEDAKLKKESIPDTGEVDGLKGMRLSFMIGPNKNDDLNRFINEELVHNFTDENVVIYSSDGEFDLYGFNHQGSTIHKIRLKEKVLSKLCKQSKSDI